MKKFFFILLACLLPTVGEASKGFYLTHTQPYNRRVAIVYDDKTYNYEWSIANGPATQRLANIYTQNQIGTFTDALRRAGVEVHFYNRSFFDDSMLTGGSIGLWAHLGDQYPVAVCFNFSTFFSSTSPQRSYRNTMRFFRADSTNTQIIQVGGGNNMPWWQDDPSSSPDSVLGTELYTNSSAWNPATSAYARHPFYIYTGDSLAIYPVWAQRNARMGTGISKVVTLFQMAPKLQSDSVMASMDTIWNAYRVYTTNQGFSPSLTPHADFVLMGNSSLGLEPISNILYPLICQYITVDPTKIIFDTADIADMGRSPMYSNASGAQGVRSPYNHSNLTWPRPTLVDSVLRRWKSVWQVSLNLSAYPDSLPIYASSNGWGYTCLKDPNLDIVWDNHVHEADSTLRGSNPYGRVGSIYQGGPPISRRVANRFDPTNATVYLQYGITQRLTWGDSILKANGFKTTSYMTPGADVYLALPTAACPAESSMQALANAGKLLIRGSPVFSGSATSIAQTNPTGNYATWFSYPDEEYITRDGKIMRNIAYYTASANIGSIADSTITGEVNQQTMWANGLAASNYITGLCASKPWSGYPDILNGETSTSNNRNCGLFRGRSIGTHIIYLSDFPRGYSESYYIETAAFKPIATMNAIAGKRIFKWVHAEEMDYTK